MAQCCDKLTASTIGSKGHVNFLNYVNRRNTFISSRKWEVAQNDVWSIERAGFAIKVVPSNGGQFRVHLDDVKSKADHLSLIDAEIAP